MLISPGSTQRRKPTFGRHMREEGYDPDEDIRAEDIISPAVIRKRLRMSQRQFAQAIHVPVATLQNCAPGAR